jgi:DNA end-binding protein Ku
MAPRANWKGYLKLSLVSCAVALYPASSTASRVAFNTLSRKTGNRVKRIYVDPDSGEEVGPDDQVKGYAVGKNSYVTIEDDELDAIRIESTHTVEIEKFVPRAEIDERYLDAPYYLAPDDRVAHEPFAVIRDAMRDSAMVGIGRVVIARRERMMMIEPFDKGLLATVLRYGYEVRDAGAYFEDIPDLQIPAEMKDLATVIIERKSGHFDPSEFEDRYETAVVSLIRSKQAGQPVPTFEAPKSANVVNLMDALRRSLAAEQDGSAAKAVKTGVTERPTAKAMADDMAPKEPAARKPRAGVAKSPAQVKKPSGGKVRAS